MGIFKRGVLDMGTYLCKLVNSGGVVEECFYREGESEKDVLEGLEMFEWPSGEWCITD